MTKYTKADVVRKAELINAKLRAAGKPEMLVQSSNPDGSQRRYEFAGWVYQGAGAACRAMDAMIWVMRELDITDDERRYVARAIDVARSDSFAANLLDPVERDELLRRFGGREEPVCSMCNVSHDDGTGHCQRHGKLISRSADVDK